ncbi:MAG TPA: enoyl-CoA hydratase-related protein [Actinomycetota bacterium]|nr:enoyl-CoA hydratase-related protein [Actinomycetota bacterium]
MTVKVSYEAGRADIILARPEVLNAMDWTVFDGLAAALDEIGARSDVRVVVISGEGRSFCSGIDTSALASVAGSPAEMIGRAQAGFRKLASLPLPTIAAIRGHALGAGLQLALGCDIRVVARDASLGILEATYGLVPDLGGTQRLPALVGPGIAKKMIWLKERIDGETAGRIGLAEVVVDAGDLDATVDDLAGRVATAPPLVVLATKQLVELAGSVPFASGMDEEARFQTQMLASSDFSAAVTAFMQKKDPTFTGS